MARKTCTPFCDTKKACPKHHDLLLAVMNCSDRRDHESNACIEHLESIVKANLKKGWKLNDDIPDPVRNYRFPLLHWAGVLGKCKAMEWMINYGFDVTVRTFPTQETALHRCILCLHYANVRRLSEKIRRTVDMLKDCLALQDEGQQTPLHAAAAKLITGNKSDYYADCLETMVAKAKEMPGKTSEILNAQDHLGNTALHYLAQNEIGFVVLRSIVDAGGDITIANKKKLTPLDVAMNNGSTRMIKILNSAGRKSEPSSRYDNDVYTADSPPESPVNLDENKEDENDVQSHAVNDKSLGDHSYSQPTDTQALECSENSSFSTSASEDVPSVSAKDASTEASNEVSPSNADAPSCATNDASSSDATSAPTDNDPSHANSDETPAAASNELPCDEQEDASSEDSDDALSEADEAAAPLCSASGSCVQEQCECTSIGIQTPVINPYSCIVHIKQEKLSPCERCQQESMGEISSSSELQSITTSDLANSVITLLRGAGLLDNLTQIAEKKRSEDEHVLTDKLEMVKETNNQLETSDKEIEEKNSRMASLMTELEELKQEVQTKKDERERLFRKRKSLNEECNSLQKKLHCCDSLLKVVPKVHTDSSNV